MPFNLPEHLQKVERTMTARFEEASSIAHAGDRGENREDILREFLKKYLPSRYGLTKGQVVTKEGRISHSIDIIIYDRLVCPVFFSGKTAILPIEGVYGIIEVKSSLSKSELEDAASKIKSFKELAPRDLGIVELRHAVTVRRASRPFGIVFGYQLTTNSLGSLKSNIKEIHGHAYWSNYFVNLICILGVGNIYLEGIRWDMGGGSILLKQTKLYLFSKIWNMIVVQK